jgi:hypothetical protein
MEKRMLQPPRRFVWILACVFGLLCVALPSVAQITTVRMSVHNDTSPAVRDLPTLEQQGLNAHHGPREAEPVRRIPLPSGLKPAEIPDQVLQRTTVAGPFNAATSALAPTLNLGFDGVGSGFPGFTVNSAPPDTNGAVGATQYVQWVNSSFAVFDKATGARIAGPTAGNALWAGFGGGCQTNNDGDPIVLYDKAANRWVFAQFSVSTTPFLQCVAVSTTSDATGTFNRYSFQYSFFDDYPKMGVWPDAYYTTFNMFNGNSFVGADACAYDRNAMLQGLPATQICKQQGSSVGGLLPADLDGTTPPPAGSPNFLVFFGSNSLNLFKFHVDFANPANSTFTGPTVIPVAAFTPLCNGGTCVVQPGTTNRLDSLADRLMYRLAYRNFGDHESLVVNHSVAAGSSGGVRWYEIQNPNGTPVLAQQSTFAPDSNFRWMGSIAMDQAGDMAMGYSVASSTINPSIRFTGRQPTDPANTMQTESNIMVGGGSQTGTLTRWGDYSAITVDPVDDCTFWYTTEYLKANGSFNWSTRIANFKFPNCGGAAGFSLTASPASLTVTQGSSGSSTITVNPINGFTGAVSLAASGMPAGVTASFNPASTTSTSTLTLTASGTATTGTATVTVTGTSGATSHTTTITLTVNAPAQPNFTLSASPSSLSVTQGNSGSSTVTVNPVNGFTGTVSLSASGLPAGVTASFNPTSTATTSTVTFTVSSTATVGTANITITGTSGTLTHTATISLTIASGAAQQLLGNPGFENATAAPWTLTAGVLNSSAAEPPHSGTKDAWLDGYGTTHTDSATQTVTIPSTATTATLSFWLHIDTAETTTVTAFDTLQVQVLNSAGTTVLATLGTFSNLNKAPGYIQRSFSVIQFKGQTVRIRFLGHEDSSLQTSFVIDDTALTVQ